MAERVRLQQQDRVVQVLLTRVNLCLIRLDQLDHRVKQLERCRV